MKKYALIGLLLITVLFGGWYFASPSLALKGLADAAKAGDATAIEGRVDFSAVRTSFKEQFKAKLAVEAKKPNADPMAKMGLAFAEQMLNPMVDKMITPTSVATMIAQGGTLGATVKGSDAKPAQNADDWKIERTGFSEFHVQSIKDENGPKLIFKRAGLSWKLSGIDISKVHLGK
jgi:Protein of unknown function (DUF2939)